MLSVVHCGHVPPVGRMVEILLLSPRRQDQLRADPPSVGGLPVEPDLQIVMDVVIGLDVLVDRGRRVDVIDHEVELAVVIEIRIGRAIRKAPSIHAPLLGHVRERQVTLVPKQVVREVVTGQLLQESQRPAIVSGPARPEHGRLVIEIVDRLGIAVGDEDVLVPIVIEIGEQSTPAPVRVRDARQAADLAEDDVSVLGEAVAQLQRVDVEVIAESPGMQLHATAVGEVPAHPFASGQARRHHVHLNNVGPAVVVEVGDVDPHPREAGVLEPSRGLVGERAIAVVDVEDIVGRDVVRDVDVGSPIPVEVGDGHAESITDLSQDAGLLGYVRERSVAVVPIELIVTAGARAPQTRGVEGRFRARKILG